ncbi:MAG: methylmalonyl Co-A mutase-associated GTPase MeaB [Gemmatimonadota bacterium]
MPAPTMTPALEALHQGFRHGQRRALARAITLVESQRSGFQDFLHHVLAGSPPSGRRVGITGPPGAGKSTLVAALATGLRARDREVAVVAVDPTSPYSGGALLGDRIRMNDVAMDPGIFIRSMASRGSLGGLATTTAEVLDLVDAFGFPDILVETVGVGQTELEITGTADTVVVVLVPESGDGIQAMKAGLMEIADVFVVNKADRPGADRMVKELRTAIHLRTPMESSRSGSEPAHHGVDFSRMRKRETRESPVDPSGWTIPVLSTVAHREEGLEEVHDALDAHARFLRESGELELRRKDRAFRRIRAVAQRDLARRLERLMHENGEERAAHRVAQGLSTPYGESARLVESLLSEPFEGC